jgi:hypothetical protein
MSTNFDFEFFYTDGPVVSVEMRSLITGLLVAAEAWIDTGAEISLFDAALADELGMDLSNSPERLLVGVGGQISARLAPIDLRLLGEEDLSVVVEIGFVVGQTERLSNLLGLDVLSSFDFGLSHGNRTGYIGRRQ